VDAGKALIILAVQPLQFTLVGELMRLCIPIILLKKVK